MTNPCWLFMTSHSIYSQLPSINLKNVSFSPALRMCHAMVTHPSKINLHLWQVFVYAWTLDLGQLLAVWSSLKVVCATDSKLPAPCCVLLELSQTQGLAKGSVQLQFDLPDLCILLHPGSSHSSSVDAAIAAGKQQAPRIL
jgi:hypothetical protein